jgi:hypothetical protein
MNRKRETNIRYSDRHGKMTFRTDFINVSSHIALEAFFASIQLWPVDKTRMGMLPAEKEMVEMQKDNKKEGKMVE